MSMARVTFDRDGKPTTATFDGANWSCPADKVLAGALTAQWSIADRSPALGFAARSHVAAMAGVLGGKAEFDPDPDFDGDGGRLALFSASDPTAISLAAHLGISVDDLAVLEPEDFDELLAEDETGPIGLATDDEDEGDSPGLFSRWVAVFSGKRKRRKDTGHAVTRSGLARKPYDESKHLRGEGGRFKNKPGAGDNAPAPKRDSADFYTLPGQRLDDRGTRHAHGQLHRDAEGWAGSLTDGEAKALSSYKRDGYRNINGALRKGKEPGPATKTIDSALAKASFPRDTIVYRGIKGDVAKRINSAGSHEGIEIHDKGFTSFSADYGVASDFTGYRRGAAAVLAVRIPKGAKAAYMDRVAAAPHGKLELEILAARGGTIRITKRLKDQKDGPVYLADYIPAGTEGGG